MNQKLKDELIEKMNKAIAIFEKELSGLRTGRASPNLLDSVVIEAYGNKMPISQVGTVSTPDSQTIAVQVWDKAMVRIIEKAILDSNLGLNPAVDGQMIRMNLPKLSGERREELVKIALRCSENSKVTLRNIRRDGMDILKKMHKDKEISEDEQRDFAEEIQKITDEFIDKIDNITKVKEKEIKTI